MIEHLELQLARLWRLARQSGQEAQIIDSVKRHHRIRLQKPEIGELALSIASMEAAIASHKDAVAKGGKVLMDQKEYGEAVQNMVEVAQRHDAEKEQDNGRTEQREGAAGREGGDPGRAESGAGEGAGAVAGSSP